MALPKCEQELDEIVGETITEFTEWLQRIENKLDTLLALYERFRPLIDRYDQVSKAQGFRAQRAAMKGTKNV